MREVRPSPEALLELARSEQAGRGRLKIFLGAAPGVGKTYEMLLSGRARLSAGDDVVAGIVETHGRAETEALLDGLEVTPRKSIEYKGRVLDEMDLDALLARRPKLALVDELAHTNAPGSRHPKRYLDVEELLAAGIDVYTTLNIQHVESLNDVVEQITGIRVRETVPDSILDRADDIEVIDLAPDELMQRLREGKVYVPKEAERALKNYFSPGNLTALRELALRRTAQRVDEQLLTHMKAHAIEGPWPAGERVLVCISEDPHSAGLVRYTKRVADRLRAPWTALYIETLRGQDLSVVERDRIADTLRLAERLGGVAATLPGRGRVADDIIDFARSNNVTQIVIGKTSRTRWFELLHGSVVHDLVRRSGNISVHVIAGDALKEEAIPRKDCQDQPASGANIAGYFAAAWMTAACVIASRASATLFRREDRAADFHDGGARRCVPFWSRPIDPGGGGEHALLQFLFHSAHIQLHHCRPDQRRRPFLLPVHGPCRQQPDRTGSASGRISRAIGPRSQARFMASRSNLASKATLDDLLWASASQIAASLRADVVILLPEANGQLKIASAFPPDDMIEKRRPWRGAHGASTMAVLRAADQTLCPERGACFFRFGPAAA